MFWKLATLSTSSPNSVERKIFFAVEFLLYAILFGASFELLYGFNLDVGHAAHLVESVLDKENFTLEELLDEEEIIQECKALNSRLINLDGDCTLLICDAGGMASTSHETVDEGNPIQSTEKRAMHHLDASHVTPAFTCFLRDRVQVEQLLRYITEEAPEDAESKRVFKFPFIACEIFTCEIDVIFKTLIEEEELMNLLFSFLEPNRPHSALLAGYFGKVVVCLMLRKTVPLMSYVQAHQDVFRQLVDLIGITSIMEVLVRLVSADDHMYPNFADVMQWLADSNLIEMIVDKLSPSGHPEVHANAAETLCAITRNSPSALAAKLSSPSFVARILGHALEDSQSKSGLVHSLSVCISLLDPKRSASSPLFHSIRSQHLYEPPIPVNPVTVSAMLPKLAFNAKLAKSIDSEFFLYQDQVSLGCSVVPSCNEAIYFSVITVSNGRNGSSLLFEIVGSDLLRLLDVSSDEKVLPTTYGELRPPLGKHRLKIVEFIEVFLTTGSEVAEENLVSSGAIQRILDLFFEYPYNNSLHHHVESIIFSCLESKNNDIVDHLFRDCNLIGKILQTDAHPILSGDPNQRTLPAAGRQAPRSGNLGHITRISNKLVQLGNGNSHIQAYLQENNDWIEWQATVLQERNTVENVCRWACGYASYPVVLRPTALQDRTRDSDEDELHDRDYDVAALANNLSQAFRYNIYENEDADEGHGAFDRDDEDVYFDDESAEVVISSLRLGDDQESLFTNSNWFAFQDYRISSEPMSTSPSEKMNEINVNGTANGESSGSDDEVVVGEDEELVDGTASIEGASRSNASFLNGIIENIPMNGGELKSQDEMASASGGLGFFPCETTDNEDLFNDRQLPDWVRWRELSDLQVDGSDGNPFNDTRNGNGNGNLSVLAEAVGPTANSLSNGKVVLSNGITTAMDSSDRLIGTDLSQSSMVHSLFEEDVEFVGVELEGTEMAMEQALKEGIVGEAGPLKRNLTPKVLEKEKADEDGEGILEFNDTNYWRVDQEVGVVQE
ncbi:hypothetical protein HHK36_018939 [Tetracentron sinense]|uniref:Uncharacterized protein n=1 Tax=Tetracentron sinense TaxID=13715 RepID=A0A834YVE0_TETSI|nr:hypothetical protein HHK36_018939 [Tetracentron sinense]